MKRAFPFFAILLLSACFAGSQSPAPVTHYGGTKGEGSAGVHSVVEGDTLYSVSQRYNIVMRDIAVYNNMGASFMLNVGQRLKLPPPMEYEVREGDSLYSVSRVFGVQTSELAQINDLRAPYTIRAGQVLKLPSITQKMVSASVQRSAMVRPGQKPLAQPLQTGSAPPSRISAKTPPRSSSKFMQPVRGQVLSSYGPKKGGLHNDGINIKAPRGAPVRAADNGVVVYAGSELKGSGNLVLVRHADRYMTAYAHLDGIDVRRGQVLSRGDVLGKVGASGSVDTPQLHFEVRRGTEAIDPKRYLEG